MPTRTADRAPSQERTVGRTAARPTVRTFWNDGTAVGHCNTVVRALQLLLLSPLIFIAPLGQYFDRNPAPNQCFLANLAQKPEKQEIQPIS